MMQLPGWSSTGLPTLKLSEIPEFDRTQSSVPILDQNGKGACLPHAYSEAVMIARAISGAPFIKLSPWFLYSLINRGMDQGANAGDAIEALLTIGIATDESVPYGTIRPAGYSQQAKTIAQRFKLRDAVKIEGFEQAVSAVYFNWAVCFDLQAGPGFDTNQDGICKYLGPGNNHEVLAADKFKLINGKPYLGGRNSWGTRWGQNGHCYWSPNHLDGSNETYAVRFIQDDPQDNDLPPAIT